MTLPAFESFDSPHGLLFILPAVLCVAVLGLTGRVELGRPLRVVVTLLRALVVGALVFILAAPATLDRVSVPSRLEIAFDVSRSMGATALDFSIADARAAIAATRAAHPDAELVIAAFGDGFVELHRGRLDDPVPDAVFDLRSEGPLAVFPGRLASDPRPLLAAWAAEVDEGIRIVRRIYTDGSLPPPPRGLRLPGQTVLIPPPAAADVNVRAVRLRAPSHLRSDRPLRVTLEYEAAVARVVPARLRVDGQVVKEVEVTLEPGPGELVFGGDDLLLEAGGHELEVELEAVDDEPLDDAAGAFVDVIEARVMRYVPGDESGGERAAPLRALRAQGVGLEVTAPAGLTLDEAQWRRTSAVILDRVAPGDLAPEVANRLDRFVAEGGGLLVFPRGDEDELLRWNVHPLGALLPLAGVPVPRRSPDQKDPKPDPDEAKPERLSDPDPERAEEREIDAPTLILVLVIDKSASMKQGGKLQFAKLGAIQTARQLHPDDRIAVVSYNDYPTEAVPVQPARNLPEIERSIMRIAAGGGTDIEGALLLARDLLVAEDAAIKTIILLSDGVTRPFNIKSVVESLVADGISVNTVGIGSEFHTATLTQVAIYGRGTGPIPARSSREIPSVMIDVAARLMQEHGTRTRNDEPPKKPRNDDLVRPEIPVPDQDPRRSEARTTPEAASERTIEIAVERPVSYVEGLPWDVVPGIAGLHVNRSKSGAWVAIGSSSKSPFLAHWRVGDGFVACLGAPPEGAWTGEFALWNGYSVLWAQLARFLERDPAERRYHVSGEADGTAAVVDVVDTWSRTDALEGAWSVTRAGPDERTQTPAAERQVGDRFLLGELPDEAPFRRLVVRHEGRPERDDMRVSLPAPPPREVRERGLDLAGLDAWSVALGAGILTRGAPDDRQLGASWRTERRPRPRPWLFLLLLVFPLELVIKRFAARGPE